MCKYKTYKKDWESQVSWIYSVVSDQFSALCTLCNKTFKIDNGGISQVNAHGKTKRHSEIKKQRKSQRVFTSSSHVQILSNNQNVLTYDEQVICAEIFQAFKCVESNLSFASSNGDNQ